MALFNECMQSCAHIVLDIADVVRKGDITTAIRVQHRLGEAENSYTLTMVPCWAQCADTMWEASS